MTEVQEKRKNARYSVKWSARVLLPDRSLFEIPIRNVSLGGLSIVFPYVLKTGVVICIEFFVIVSGKKHRIRAKTRVAFNAVLSDGESAQLGLQFEQISDEEKSLYAEALKSLAPIE